MWPASSMSTPGLLDRVERQLLPADRALDLLTDLHREHRVMGDENPHRLRSACARKCRG